MRLIWLQYINISVELLRNSNFNYKKRIFRLISDIIIN